MLPVMRSNKYQQLAAQLEAHVRGFDNLIRAVDLMEIQIKAAICRQQYK